MPGFSNIQELTKEQIKLIQIMVDENKLELEVYAYTILSSLAINSALNQFASIDQVPVDDLIIFNKK